MIIGSKFSKKNQKYLRTIYELSEGDTTKKIAVSDLNEKLGLDRNQLKNVLEYLDALQLISIATIGGPLLYGHVTITEKGIQKISEIQ